MALICTKIKEVTFKEVDSNGFFTFNNTKDRVVKPNEVYRKHSETMGLLWTSVAPHQKVYPNASEKVFTVSVVDPDDDEKSW